MASTTETPTTPMQAPSLTRPPPPASVLPPLLLGTATFNTQHVRDPLHMPYRQIVSRALDLGVRGFDTSPYYGPAEALLGDALDALDPRPPRASYVLATKAGRIGSREFDYSPAFVRLSVLRSLRRLRTDYLDVAYLHDVEFVPESDVVPALGALRELRAEGKVRFVGISGFPVDVLCRLAEKVLAETGEPLDVVLSYGHFTIQNPALLGGPLGRLAAAGVQVALNGSMLGMGLLTQTGIPEGGGESPAADGNPDSSLSKGKTIAKWHPSPDGLRAACRRLARIAAGAGETLESVALRWAMEEYARAGADAGLGVDVDFPGRDGRGTAGIRVGGSVMGVASVSELEQTVREWNDVVAGLAPGVGAVGDGGLRGRARRERIARLVGDEMWPALGGWKGYAWESPGDGFKNERDPSMMGVLPEEASPMRMLETRTRT